MLMRDVDNLRNFFGRFAPALLATHYGEEIWTLYAAGLLRPRRRSPAATSRERRGRPVAPCCARSRTRRWKKPRAGCACRRRDNSGAFTAPPAPRGSRSR
jgi:hypothetical protein